MPGLVSRVLSHADKLVGTPISSATSWLPGQKDPYAHFLPSRRSSVDSDATVYDQRDMYRLAPPASPRIYATPPPPYEKVAASTPQSASPQTQSRFTKLSGYVWKRASFSSAAWQDSKPPIAEPSTIDKKQVEHALALINVATEIDNAGNHQMALDLYMMGLDRMISALPLDSDPNVKATLEQKLIEFKERKALDLTGSQPAEAETFDAKDESDTPLRSQFSNLVVNAAVLSAVALKKSPIPDAVSSAMSYAVSGMQAMDSAYHIRQRTMDLAGRGLAKAIEIDKQYEVHQMVTEAVYTGVTAFVKAGLAYAETPNHLQKK
ncbi:hypothetical protein DFQ28_009828 [Apophysomyces sp. BC1034]|nr:hypothetical protein DFQ30_007369 [Apophysomyces sp. BC1015]KAG0178825.1 hypothetical protein DFQ29_002942 [Apophysomyces sp. BC1021]KAG0185183.1 hypothetical protein DFQ28_009828 [Apophysomyces sp. BC1034]